MKTKRTLCLLLSALLLSGCGGAAQSAEEKENAEIRAAMEDESFGHGSKLAVYDPEKAIKFLDYLISEEGQKMVYLGVEGEMYEMKDGVPVIKKEVQDLRQRTREGIETARINGKQIGQRSGNKLNVKKAAPAKEKI